MSSKPWSLCSFQVRSQFGEVYRVGTGHCLDEKNSEAKCLNEDGLQVGLNLNLNSSGQAGPCLRQVLAVGGA